MKKLGAILSMLVLAGACSSSSPRVSDAPNGPMRRAGFAEGSRAYVYRTFAEIRKDSTAIVVGVAERTTTQLVRSGYFKGAPVVLTTFAVQRNVWGTTGGASIRIAQLGGQGSPEAGRRTLREGSEYLLFLCPDNLEESSGWWAIVGDGQYVLEHDTYNLVGDSDPLPRRLSSASAERDVVS